jgi:hypothetical protein
LNNVQRLRAAAEKPMLPMPGLLAFPQLHFTIKARPLSLCDSDLTKAKKALRVLRDSIASSGFVDDAKQFLGWSKSAEDSATAVPTLITKVDEFCVAQIEAKIADAKDDPAQCDASKRADAHSKEVSKLPTRTEQEDDRLKMMNSKKSQPARLTVETQKELEQVLAKFKQDAIAIMLGNHTVLTYLFLHIPPYPDRHGFLDAQRDVYIALRTTSREVCRSLFQKEDLQGFLQHLERLRLRNLGAPRVRPKRPRVRLDTGPSVLV